MEPSESKVKGFIKETLETVITVLILVIIFRFFVGEIRVIPSESMLPTLEIKDRLFVEKISNFASEPHRGDILVFYPPQESLRKGPWAIFTRLTGFFVKDIAYVKRVIALPGEKFEIKKDINQRTYDIYINDKKIKEDYLYTKITTPCTDEMYCGPFIVPKNSYFMMGDNRENSLDSRYWGFMPKNRIIGRAAFIFRFPWQPPLKFEILKQMNYESISNKNNQAK